MADNYYKILGVEKTATKAEIKKAYKHMAMKYHPDKNQGDKKAEERFKKINEAYAVLSDDNKRKQYDQFGAEGFSNRFSQEDIFRGFDIGNIFKEFGFGGDIFSVFSNGKPEQGSPFSFGFGDGHPFKNGRGHPNRKPKDTTIRLQLSLEEAVLGSKKTISFNSGAGVDKIALSIPPGIESGKKLKVKGKGVIDQVTGRRGDLLCEVLIQPHKTFRREGKDLIVEKEVKLTELVLGGSTTVTTLEDKKIELKIPPHSKNNSFLRIKGKGIQSNSGQPGNLLVKLTAKLPDSLTDEQENLFQELARTGL